jgi:amino acid transporter
LALPVDRDAGLLQGDTVTAIASTSRGGLARRRLGTSALTIFLISASGPMTVLVGGVVTTFAVTGNIGTPLCYPVLAVALALFSVGYAAMSRYVLSAAGFYPYVAQGLGPAWGVAASFVAVLSYNAAQIGLVGLFGVVSRDFAARYLGLPLPWWVWSAVGLGIVALLGVRKVDLNAKVLFVLLGCEVGAVLAFDAGAFAHPVGGVASFAGLSPGNLLVPGVGGVFAFGVAGYLGFEQGAVYSEEARDPKRTVARATYVTVAVTGVLYTVSAWALTVGVGADRVVALARDPDSGIPFSLVAADFGGAVATVANALLITSVFACMLSIHHCVARYIFAMSRDRVVSTRLVRTGKGSAAPVAGSLIQSALSALTVLVFVLLHRDPLTELFTWLEYVSAVGVLLLMAGTSLAVVGFFRRRPELDHNRWQGVVAPLLATAVLGGIVAVTVVNADSVLGTARDSALGQILPGLVAASAVAGLAWAAVLRQYRPGTYERIGHGALDAPMPDVLSAAPPPASRRPGRRWSRPRSGVTLAEQLRALRTVWRLGPFWREIHGVVPEVALLPRYRGPAALRSTARHAPLQAIRMQVEILDGYAALAPWMSGRALAIAGEQAQRYRLAGPEADAAAEAAVLAAAVRARSRGVEPEPDGEPVHRAVLQPPDAPVGSTLTRLVQVGHALRRSPVVPATLRLLAVAEPAVRAP